MLKEKKHDKRHDKKINLDIELLKKMHYEEKKSLSQTARELGVSVSLVLNHFYDNDLEVIRYKRGAKSS